MGDDSFDKYIMYQRLYMPSIEEEEVGQIIPCHATINHVEYNTVPQIARRRCGWSTMIFGEKYNITIGRLF